MGLRQVLGERERVRAATRTSIGVIGTFNSGCAEIIIPILNRAPNGPVAMVSPANTYVGLTHGGPGTAAGEPEQVLPDRQAELRPRRRGRRLPGRGGRDAREAARAQEASTS